jgi:tetratricopeptide (TPR) repeat protein
MRSVPRLTLVCAAILLAPAAAALAGESAGDAADGPRYGPAPAWTIPAKPASPGQGAGEQPVRVLLQDNQVRFGPDADETFTETIMRAQTPQGLQALGSFSRDWNPQTDVLTINRLRILRGGEVIDVLAQGKRFTVLRRERNLEQSSLDGRLTATIQLEDLRVGDIVDFAATLSHHDPSFRGRSEQVFTENPTVTVDRMRFRALWPAAMNVRWRATEGMAAPKLRDTPVGRELLVETTDVRAPKPPKFAPPRFAELGQIQLSAYDRWADVSSALSPLFQRAATLETSSPLQAELARIRAEAHSPAAQAEAALRLAEDKVRYVFLGMDLGGYKPAEADLTWTRRFGDCKGKTVLLTALLRGLGLEATPVLVSLRRGDGMDGRLPSLLYFDHAIVRLRLDGATYWLDATRTGDRDLASLLPPSYRWALPLTAQGAELEAIAQPPLTSPLSTMAMTIDATQGLTAPAAAHAELQMKGDGALAIGQLIRQASSADVEKAGRQFWSGRYAWITVKSLQTTFDPATGVARFAMDGVAQLDWTEDDPGLGRRLDLPASAFAAGPDLKREADSRQDAPYAVPYPSYDAASVRILLPDHASGYRIEGRDIDRTFGGVRYQRVTTLEGGAVVSRISLRSTAPEFPASEALTVQHGLAELAAETVAVRAPVDYGPTRKELQGLSALDPTTTEGFFRRAGEMLGKGETDKAIADYDGVIRREPGMAQAYLSRGLAWRRKGPIERALGDYDQALKLQPDLLVALYARSQDRQAAGRPQEALADADAAVRLAPNTIAPYQNRALLLLTQKAPERALADFDAALKLNSEDKLALAGRARALAALGRPSEAAADLAAIGETADILNERCFARAIAGVTLDAALGECDAAVRLAPSSAAILDSRGFVRFRRGEWARALADFDAALKLDPRQAPTLYVRGLARKRLGRGREGEADIAAALALDAQVARTYADYGVTP